MSEIAEANLILKREEREGIVPVGTYLSDAAARMGVRPELKCVPPESLHFCRVSVLEGAEHLSPRTEHETEHLTADSGKPDDRLGCQTKIAAAGEIVIMTSEEKEKSPEEKAEEAAKAYTKEFAELPLEKKFEQLVQLEAMALGETVSFVFNAPYLLFGKAMDVMADFGLRKEAEGKKAARPAEHVEPEAEADEGSQEESGSDEAGK